jgi:aryl-phospho-beta-D-glucosidase BglC (GH1 family)
MAFSLLCYAQLTPQDAIKEIRRGINIGNTLDPPDGEGTWNNGPVQEYYFDDYKAAGFDIIRIPITWYKHAGNSSPYTVDAALLNRVEQIVDWGLARGLYILINAHHEEEIKGNYSNKAIRDKFDSIWSQVASRLKNKSDKLFFEILNEPNPMAQNNLDELNARILSIIRKSNPTRIVVYSGNNYSNSAELIAAKIPDVNDKYLMAYFHSYDPWNFAGLATGKYGTAADVSGTKTKFDQVANWSASKNIPVLLDECGAIGGCDYNSKMLYLATVTEQALNHNIGFCLWDDGGDFQSYLRSQRKWNDNKDVVIYTYKQSPTALKFSVVKDTITLSWQNRTTKNDSIIVERKVLDGVFAQVGKIGPLETSFKDSIVGTSKTYYYRVRTNIKDSIQLYSYPQVIVSAPKSRTPYSGKVINVPGIIQAENFDTGGEGLTYHDVDSENLGGAYRTTEGVDIETDGSDSYFVDNVNEGEWMEYAISVPDSTEYDISGFVASMNGGGQFKFTFIKGKKYLSSSIVTVPKTNGWQNPQMVSTSMVLPAGNLIMKVSVIALPAFNLDKFKIVNPLIAGIEKSNEEDVIFYPNPAQEKISITDISVKEISLLDISGKILLHHVLQTKDREVNVNSLQPGIYLVKCKRDDAIVWKKLIKE